MLAGRALRDRDALQEHRTLGGVELGGLINAGRGIVLITFGTEAGSSE